MTIKSSLIPGPPCFWTSAGMLSTPGDLSFFNIRTAFSTSSLSIDACPVSLFSIVSSFFKILYLHQLLICRFTAPSSIPSTVSGWISLLLRVCPSYRRFRIQGVYRIVHNFTAEQNHSILFVILNWQHNCCWWQDNITNGVNEALFVIKRIFVAKIFCKVNDSSVVF